MKNKQIPPEVTNEVLNEVEKVAFPKPAKTKGGKILRVLFKIFKIFAPKIR